MNFTEKQLNFIAKCIGAAILIISCGFVLTFMTTWPKEFRQGTFNRLAEIAFIQSETKEEYRQLDNKVNLLIKKLENQIAFQFDNEEK